MTLPSISKITPDYPKLLLIINKDIQKVKVLMANIEMKKIRVM